jgi:hypothetical protein
MSMRHLENAIREPEQVLRVGQSQKKSPRRPKSKKDVDVNRDAANNPFTR